MYLLAKKYSHFLFQIINKVIEIPFFIYSYLINSSKFFSQPFWIFINLLFIIAFFVSLSKYFNHHVIFLGCNVDWIIAHVAKYSIRNLYHSALNRLDHDSKTVYKNKFSSECVSLLSIHFPRFTHLYFFRIYFSFHYLQLKVSNAFDLFSLFGFVFAVTVILHNYYLMFWFRFICCILQKATNFCIHFSLFLFTLHLFSFIYLHSYILQYK